MTSQTESHSRLFTIEEANAMLPLVRAIVADLVGLSGDVAERRQRLDYLLLGRDPEEQGPYVEELTQMEADLERDTLRLKEYAKELADLGVELKSATDGLVDFPARLDGREVYLCWRHDEAEVAFWHDLQGGYETRRSLTAAAGEGRE